MNELTTASTDANAIRVVLKLLPGWSFLPDSPKHQTELGSLDEAIAIARVAYPCYCAACSSR